MKPLRVHPRVLLVEGLVATARGRPAFGVWIMPDNRSRGMLESFLIRQLDAIKQKMLSEKCQL